MIMVTFPIGVYTRNTGHNQKQCTGCDQRAKDGPALAWAIQGGGAQRKGSVLYQESACLLHVQIAMEQI